MSHNAIHPNVTRSTAAGVATTSVDALTIAVEHIATDLLDLADKVEQVTFGVDTPGENAAAAGRVQHLIIAALANMKFDGLTGAAAQADAYAAIAAREV